MQALGRAGLIRSQRGLNGGFTLKGKPESLTVWDVVQAVDPLKRITKCPLSLEWHGTRLCPLHEKLDDALAQAERALRETTIQSVLEERRVAKNRCRFPGGLQTNSKTTPAAH